MQNYRRMIVGCIVAVTGLHLAGNTFAQAFPTHPIRIIVALAPGGGTDNLTRVMAAKMSDPLGQQVVVENKAGAGGQIGADYVAKSPPDGYTLLNTDTSFASNPSLFKKLPYDSVKDFAPVSLLASSPVLLLIHPSVPAKSLKELLALAHSKPKLFNFAMGGFGSGTHLSVEQFKMATKIDIVVIPYKGGGPATADVVAGQVVMMFGGPSSLVQHVKSGRLRAIAVTGDKHLPALPEVPTFNELGMPEVNATSYWFSLAPAGTPRNVINMLSTAMVKTLQLDDVRQRLINMGYEPLGTTPEVLAENLRSEMDKWAKAIKASGIKLE